MSDECGVISGGERVMGNEEAVRRLSISAGVSGLTQGQGGARECPGLNPLKRAYPGLEKINPLRGFLVLKRIGADMWAINTYDGGFS